MAASFAGAVVGDLEGQLSGRIAVLVGEDLVAALAASPLGGLDLASALQPTLDAMAAALHGQVGAAREVDLRLVADDIGPAFSCSTPGRHRPPRPPSCSRTTRCAPRSTPPRSRPRSRVPRCRPQPAQAPQSLPLASVPAGSVSRGGDGRRRGIEMLHGVDMEVTVELGRTRMTVRELLALSPGDVLELDRAAGSPADLLVNGRLIARGEVVVVDEDFGLRITEIVTDVRGGLTMLELTLRLVFSLAVVLGLLLLTREASAPAGSAARTVPSCASCTASRSAAAPRSRWWRSASRVLVLGTTEQQVRVLTELDPATRSSSPDVGRRARSTAEAPRTRRRGRRGAHRGRRPGPGRGPLCRSRLAQRRRPSRPGTPCLSPDTVAPGAGRTL